MEGGAGKTDFAARAAALFIVAAGAFLRLYGIGGAGVENLDGDAAAMALGSASIIHYKTPILGYMFSYEPPLSLYYPAPFMLAFGRDIWVLLIAPVLFGIGTVVLTYMAGRELFSRRAGLLASLCVAVFPFAVTHSFLLRQHSFTPLFTAAVIYLFARYTRNRAPRPVCAAALLCGIALSTKIVFLYFFAAFAAAFFVSGYHRSVGFDAKLAVRATAWFALGALPFILWVVFSDGLIEQLAGAPGARAARSFSTVLGMISKRFEMFDMVFTPVPKWLGALWLASIAVFRKADRRMTFLFVLCLVSTLLSSFVVYGMKKDQLLFVLPLPFLFGAGMIETMPFFRRPVAARATAVTVAVAVAVFFFSFSFPSDFRPPGVCVSGMEPFLKRTEVASVISNQYMVSVIHAYYRYMSTGELDDFQIYNATSLRCNRFRKCEGTTRDPLKTPYRSIVMYYSALAGNPYEDLYSNADPEAPGHRDLIRRTIIELAEREKFRYFVLDVPFEGQMKTHRINRETRLLTLDALNELAAEGLFAAEKIAEYRNDRYKYVVIEVKQAGTDSGHR